MLCLYDEVMPPGFLEVGRCDSPMAVLSAFKFPREVGHFIVDHEKIDAHRMEP